jgi:two-component system cell cycle sensor histidine kinase/response regulator CckA
VRDRQLVAAALADEGLACGFSYAKTQEEYERALGQGEFDLILADFSLPSFNGTKALALAQKARPEAPFVFVSGTIGEDRAVESLRSGATDYVLKDRLERLTPVVRRALQERELRRARQEAEARLRAGEERYRLLFNSSTDAVVVYDGVGEDGLPGKFIEVNDIACQRLGYTREEMLEMSPGEVDAPETIAALPAVMRRLAANGQAVWEGVHLTKAGKRIPVEIISRLFEMDGKRMYLATARDITERKQAEEALRQSENELAEAQRLARYGNWSWDITRDRLTWSDELYRLFGVEKTKCCQTYASYFERVDPADQEAVRQASRKARTEGMPFEIVYGINTPAGEKRVIREQGYAIRDEAGKVVRLVGTAQDITAQHQAEAELRWKTAFLEAQVNSSLDGILVVDGEGRKILQNQRMNQLMKIPPEIADDSNDQKQIKCVAGKVTDPQAFVEKVEYLYAHRDEISRDEIELTDGTMLDRYSSPVVGQDGSYYGRIWNFRDITERRRLEAQLRQAQKMDAIGQLAGGVAHDFNNMLAVIRGNADLLLMDEAQLSKETSEGLKQVVSAAERAANLTRQLLMFSRQQVMRSQPVVLDDLIRNLLKMLQRIIRENIRLECIYQKESCFVQADPGMMEQVLLNLVVNARDAMPSGGVVRIATERVAVNEGAARGRPEVGSGEFVCLSVSDNGMGIAPEHLPRIFDPFFTTKEPGRGTGLGLATVYGIVKQHQGWVEVSSTVGRGTTFKVFLPAIPPPAATGEAQHAETKRRGGTETILLVEDDDALRLVTRRALESYGYKICEAACGRAALEVWDRQAGEIALLLSDIMMPEGLTGRDLAEQLQAKKPGLPVILMSGYSADTLGKGTDFLRRTGSYFLQKPCPTSTLVQTVRQCLDEKPAPA